MYALLSFDVLRFIRIHLRYVFTSTKSFRLESSMLLTFYYELSLIKLGTRVIRGPDWNHKYEDNGEGFIGTIVAFDLPERRINVTWNSGRSGKYRADPGRNTIGPRNSCTTRVAVKGIFEGGEVVRGPNSIHDLESDDGYLEWQLKWLYITRIPSKDITRDVRLQLPGPGNETWKGHWLTKAVFLEAFATESYKDALRQANIMRICDHKDIVKFIGITHELEWIIIEWFSENTLSEILSTDAKDVINLPKVVDIAARVTTIDKQTLFLMHCMFLK
ncbi:MIB [Mytilus coruscus]|uniref:MIB n=1 Tax=Mytilus coruscus TaxID=42192 RepID=A0A6J7ZUT4_MYTCO|nr:MIB [Mytilus coruscus]